MTPDEQLKETLLSQQLDNAQLSELRTNRNDVENLLRSEFTSSSPSIQYAGSYKKKTMIREDYDLDLTCYFERDDTSAGGTLQDIYDSVCDTLSSEYQVERKRSALRLKRIGMGSTFTDLCIDVVPGRFTDDSRTDVFLNQENGEKGRLRTNLQIHLKHIRDSGVRDAIKLAKLWSCQRNIGIKTFVLELLVVDLLTEHHTAALSDQFTTVLLAFRDRSESLSVCDPANGNNDLNPMLDEVRSSLAAWASGSLEALDQGDWTSVLGKLPERARSRKEVADALGRAAGSSPAVRPWLRLG